MAAAPNAAKTAVVRVAPSSAREGARNRPATPANTLPMTQARRRTSTGSSPLMETRSALSTTPRMTMPDRTDRKNQYSVAAATAEKRNRMICAQVTFTPSICTADRGRKPGKAGGLGAHHRDPRHPAIRMMPTVPTTLIRPAAPPSVRATPSTSTPRAGANTPKQGRAGKAEQGTGGEAGNDAGKEFLA